MVLIKMVSDYFLEHKTIISFEKPDVILRDLMLRVLHKITHGKVRDLNNSTILKSSIEQTSRHYHTPLPGINYPNPNDNDGILSHVPTPCGSSQIINTNPNSKGGANVVAENKDDETPASNNGINCNNGLGISINGRGFDVDDERIPTHKPTSNPGEQSATTKAYPTDATPGSTNEINRSNENNGESLSHAPHEPSPIVNISPDTEGAGINGENGEFADSGTMKNYGECNNTTPELSYTHVNNNNDNKCEHP